MKTGDGKFQREIMALRAKSILNKMVSEGKGVRYIQDF